MPFFQGGEMFVHLQKEYRFSEERTKFYAAQVALGLGFLHRNNIIYRDLKPENLVFDKLGNVHITDFGISITDTEESEDIVGTPIYISPEIILKKEYSE